MKKEQVIEKYVNELKDKFEMDFLCDENYEEENRRKRSNYELLEEYEENLGVGECVYDYILDELDDTYLEQIKEDMQYEFIGSAISREDGEYEYQAEECYDILVEISRKIFHYQEEKLEKEHEDYIEELADMLADETRTETKELMEYVFGCYGDEERLNEIINMEVETFIESISTPMDMKLTHLKNGIEMNVYDYLTSHEILDMLKLDKYKNVNVIDKLCDKLTNEIYDYLDDEASKRDRNLCYDEEER